MPNRDRALRSRLKNIDFDVLEVRRSRSLESFIKELQGIGVDDTSMVPIIVAT